MTKKEVLDSRVDRVKGTGRVFQTKLCINQNDQVETKIEITQRKISIKNS